MPLLVGDGVGTDTAGPDLLHGVRGLIDDDVDVEPAGRAVGECAAGTGHVRERALDRDRGLFDRLRGTYQLDRSRGDDLRQAAEQATPRRRPGRETERIGA